MMELRQQLEAWAEQGKRAPADSHADWHVAKRLLSHGIEALDRIAQLKTDLAAAQAALNRSALHQQWLVATHERDEARAERDKAEADRDAIRELMNVYNLGGWTDALEPMKRALKAEAEAAAEREALSQAAADVLAERQRQKAVEGWSERHDDNHDCDELAKAAACYAVAYPKGKCPKSWPWDGSWWKPKDRRRNLVRAAALLLAQIERDDRGAAHD